MIIENGLNYSIEEIVDIFEDAEWSSYLKNMDQFIQSLKNSLDHYLIRDQNKILAYARILGDGINTILIQDIIVRKEYQNNGIGTKLLQEILKKYNDVRQIILICDNEEKLEKFYIKNGMKFITDYKCNCFAKLN